MSGVTTSNLTVLKQRAVSRLFTLHQLSKEERLRIIDWLAIGAADFVLPLFGVPPAQDDELVVLLKRSINAIAMHATDN